MLILDTNVISEVMRSSPSPRVLGWWSQWQADELFISTITMAEILYGIDLLPKGKRRDGLAAEAETMFTQDFGGRILHFDEDAARAFAEIATRRRRQGSPIADFDAQIAAIRRFSWSDARHAHHRRFRRMRCAVGKSLAVRSLD